MCGEGAGPDAGSAGVAAVAVEKTVHIEGLRELQTALHELPKATAKNVMRRVLLERAKPIADSASSRARVRSGALKTSFKAGTKLSRRQKSENGSLGDTVEVYIGPSPLVQAITEEFGTDKVTANPMLRPAWHSGKDKVLEGIKEDMWKEIKKAADRLARKAAKAARAAGG